MKNDNVKFKILEHTADLKIKAYGKTLPELFVNLAQGMASQQLGVENLSEAGQTRGEWEEVAVEADGLESLLVDWLNEILYRSDVKVKVYSEFELLEFSESPYKIKTRMRGLALAQKKLEIKAATYHQLEIKKTDGGWEATVIFDI
jgi:SHS2 domain-containing protein